MEQEGGTLFALFAYTTVGDKECDIDLSRYGCAPGAHLAEIALKHGRFHLRGLAQVARAVGYESQSKFSAEFKKVFGMLPSEFRKLHAGH